MDKLQWEQILKKKEARISQWDHFHRLIENDLLGDDIEMYKEVK